MAILNSLIIYNNTATALSYASGTISIAANSSANVPKSAWTDLVADNSIFADIRSGKVNLGDGNITTSFYSAEHLLSSIGPSIVTTQYEINDKDLKLARAIATVGTNGQALIAVKIPGKFNTTDGRYVAGGYAISADFNADDYVTCWVEDTDRLIAAASSTTTTPLTDAQMQANGYPNYPVVKYYTDMELPATNQGWYFWPLAQGNNLTPVGECEIEPIAGYGFIPAGMYLKIQYQRPAGITTGTIRTNIYWGKKG